MVDSQLCVSVVPSRRRCAPAIGDLSRRDDDLSARWWTEPRRQLNNTHGTRLFHHPRSPRRDPLTLDFEVLLVPPAGDQDPAHPPPPAHRRTRLAIRTRPAPAGPLGGRGILPAPPDPLPPPKADQPPQGLPAPR